MIRLSQVSCSVPPSFFFTSIDFGAGQRAPAVDLGDLVLLHQEVDALDDALGHLAAAGVRRAEVHRRVAGDPELVLLVGQDVRQLGVAQQRLRGDAAHVEADTAPVLVLHDGDALAELGGADGGDVPTGAGTEDDDVEVLAHGAEPRGSGRRCKRRAADPFLRTVCNNASYAYVCRSDPDEGTPMTTAPPQARPRTLTRVRRSADPGRVDLDRRDGRLRAVLLHVVGWVTLGVHRRPAALRGRGRSGVFGVGPRPHGLHPRHAARLRRRPHRRHRQHHPQADGRRQAAGVGRLLVLPRPLDRSCSCCACCSSLGVALAGRPGRERRLDACTASPALDRHRWSPASSSTSSAILNLVVLVGIVKVFRDDAPRRVRRGGRSRST